MILTAEDYVQFCKDIYYLRENKKRDLNEIDLEVLGMNGDKLEIQEKYTLQDINQIINN